MLIIWCTLLSNKLLHGIRWKEGWTIFLWFSSRGRTLDWLPNGIKIIEHVKGKGVKKEVAMMSALEPSFINKLCGYRVCSSAQLRPITRLQTREPSVVREMMWRWRGWTEEDKVWFLQRESTQWGSTFRHIIWMHNPCQKFQIGLAIGE